MAKVHGNDPTGYSYGDADALRAAARSLASAIDGQTATRAVAVSNAGREFRGYFSQVFVDNAGIASRSASKLSDALSSLVGFVYELREAAKQEDRRRAGAVPDAFPEYCRCHTRGPLPGSRTEFRWRASNDVVNVHLGIEREF